MGHELRRWLADRLPAEISSGERLVALEAADLAWDETRTASRRDLMEVMIRRTGFGNAKQIGKVLGKLAARGIELRAKIKDRNGHVVTDESGRALYACKGHELELYIPTDDECPALVKLPRTGDLQSSPARETNERKGPPPGPKGPPPGAQSSPAGGTLTTNTTETTETLFGPVAPSAPRQRSADDGPAFVAFWEHYPKKTDKDGARRQWKRAIKDGADPQEIITGAKAYAAEWHGAPAEERCYITKASNWLKDAMWSGTWHPRAPSRPVQQPRGGYRSPIPDHDEWNTGNVQVNL